MRRESLIGLVGWKSRQVGPHRAAIGSSVGGPGSVRGSVRGGGGSRGGFERGSPRSGARGYFCCSSFELLFWAHPPAGADVETHRGRSGRGTPLCPREASALQWSLPISPATFAGWSGPAHLASRIREFSFQKHLPQSAGLSCPVNHVGVVPSIKSGASSVRTPRLLSSLNSWDLIEVANGSCLAPSRSPRWFALERGPLDTLWDLKGSAEISTLGTQFGI